MVHQRKHGAGSHVAGILAYLGCIIYDLGNARRAGFADMGQNSTDLLNRMIVSYCMCLNVVRNLEKMISERGLMF